MRLFLQISIYFLTMLTICKAQTFYIYKDDELYKQIQDTSVILSFDKAFQFQIKDKLPDGTYIVYNEKRDVKKSAAKRLLLFKGQYVDSLKEGTFYYYTTSNKSFLTLLENYHKGKRQGDYFEYENSQLVLKAFYQEGKREGTTVSFKNGIISGISLYNDGILKDWIIYENERVYSINNNSNLGSTKSTFYNAKGVKTFVLEYNTENILSIKEYHSNGNLKIEKIGNFKKQTHDFQFSLEIILKIPLVNGVERIYNEMGKVISEVEIK